VLYAARFLPDKPYVYVFYWARTGTLLHLKDPRTFGQKIQWLKLHGNLEQFAKYADKYTVREYVEQAIGKKYLIPLIGVWDTAEAVPFDQLPKRFVLKVTDGCEYNYICKDKSVIDEVAVRAQLRAWQQEDFGKLEREAQYGPSKSRIVGEQYLEDDSGGLRDYKFHCSNGAVHYIQIDVDRFNGHKSEMRDLNWQKVDIKPAFSFDELEVDLPKPKNLDQMILLAEKLAAPFPYVRVDLYTVGTAIYFGELTFTPGSGTVRLKPDEGDVTFGDLIDLSAYTKPVTA